jgi:hypothetical protein
VRVWEAVGENDGVIFGGRVEVLAGKPGVIVLLGTTETVLVPLVGTTVAGVIVPSRGVPLSVTPGDANGV